MDLSAALRQAIDESLEGRSVRELAPAARRLSARYRDPAAPHPGPLGELDAAAYVASRMPATFGALQHVFRQIVWARPTLAPKSLLDIGAGPGTAIWAAAGAWPSLATAVALEADSRMRQWGERLERALGESGVPRVTWRAADARQEHFTPRSFDVVVAGYVVGELDEDARIRLVEKLWAAARDVLILVEPGTPQGFRHLDRLRDHLIRMGAHVVAPCPHDLPCPLVDNDWCHFAERIPRSRLHRLLKGGEAPFEDEKFSYQAFSREAEGPGAPRILRHPERRSGYVRLRLCTADGIVERTVSRRHGDQFRTARKSDWGDSFPGAPE